jgi:hypothetical protein
MVLRGVHVACRFVLANGEITRLKQGDLADIIRVDCGRVNRLTITRPSDNGPNQIFLSVAGNICPIELPEVGEISNIVICAIAAGSGLGVDPLDQSLRSFRFVRK